jgi:hypothetical protein
VALRAVPDHPKFADLKARLGRPRCTVLGCLEAMWHFARFAPQGNIGKYTNSAIEKWLEWDGKSGELISALIKSGWIERNDAYRLIVHDWHEHVYGLILKEDWLATQNLDLRSVDPRPIPGTSCGKSVRADPMLGSPRSGSSQSEASTERRRNPRMVVEDTVAQSADARYPILEVILSLRKLTLKSDYSHQEIAELFNVTLRTIQAWIADGRLATNDWPGGSRVLPADLEAFLQASKRQRGPSRRDMS